MLIGGLWVQVPPSGLKMKINYDGQFPLTIVYTDVNRDIEQVVTVNSIAEIENDRPFIVIKTSGEKQ